MVLRRLPLKGVHNLRDLGGYPAENGKVTKWKLIFRADGLFELDGGDIDSVMDYCKIKTVIDLRSTIELVARPNNFAGIAGINYVSVPLITESRKQVEIAEEWRKLDTGYIGVAKHGKKEIKRIFEIIAETFPEPVLYHCTAGKDRTGIVSCLILGLCGVDDFDIVTDYEVSSTYIKRNLTKVIEPGMQLDAVNMGYIASPPKTMRRFIDFITREYGSVEQFLLDCGIEQEIISCIKREFLVDITD